MRILNISLNLDLFFEKLHQSRVRGLLLDYDGTLAPFRVERDQAIPYPGVQNLLKNLLTDKNLRLVFITGRSVKDFLPLIDLPGPFEVWGSHGWERRRHNGILETGMLPQSWNEALDLAYKELIRMGWGSQAERKFASVAMHWRGYSHDEAKRMRDQVIAKWRPLLMNKGLILQDFDGGVELRATSRDKGVSTRILLSEWGPAAVTAYLGDDLTDEDAFWAIKGKGLGVLVRNELIPTQADLWIKPPEELLDFLTRWKSASDS